MCLILERIILAVSKDHGSQVTTLWAKTGLYCQVILLMGVDTDKKFLCGVAGVGLSANEFELDSQAEGV